MDYEKLGFKCGLEIHQQLDTKKLFCNCQSILRKDEPDFIVRRRLHAVAGESGEVDVAAKHEMGKDKEFVYQGYDTTCLVELDEEPPHEINKDALNIALQISLLLNCRILPLTQIMRKTVIDGSNTSGFQRTVLIAQDGYVETDGGRVGINAVILEEDAARIVSRTPQAYPEKSSTKIFTKGKDEVVYKLDRLGIPLVEIVTAPDIKTPEQAKNVSLKIGEILRSCRVRRGIGTIRQDVSISIEHGKRIEMKGVQDLKLIVPTINNEIERQIDLVKMKKSVAEVRRGNPDATTSFLRPLPGSARMYPETDLPMLKISRDLINKIKKNLPRLRKDIEEELNRKGLNQEMIKLIFKMNKLEEFRELLELVSNPQLVAKVVLMLPKEIASHKKVSFEKIEKILNKDILAFVLEKYKKRKISERQIKESLERIVKGVDVNMAVKFENEDLGNVEEKIMKIIKEKPGLSEKAYMGLVMKEFRGKVDGKIAMEIIKKYIK
ncbi:Glu-tRNA(Gln) amidotransferase subunit GatE [Candidatus Pacearchaeota archaeon]|nr:Glu-tRNA(Gln) amidotransferase subunit GatE [Candidatus Pacearchaeota archaeon]